MLLRLGWINRLVRPSTPAGQIAVPYRFRSSFRDWAAERTDHPREVIEAALAHVVQNKVEALRTVGPVRAAAVNGRLGGLP